MNIAFKRCIAIGNFLTIVLNSNSRYQYSLFVVGFEKNVSLWWCQ